MPDYQEASEIFLGSRRLLQRSYTSLRRDFSTIDRPPEERKSRTYPVERGTGACILPVEGIPVAGASPEASRFEQALCVTTDAFGVGVAAVLLQENDGKLYPVGYASKKLNLTEARYPIIEKECLAVVWGIKRFKLYLAGRRFTLQTDHKPLKYLKEASYQNDRVFRWAVAVQEYSFRVEDIQGKENIGADFLSRTGYSC